MASSKKSSCYCHVDNLDMSGFGGSSTLFLKKQKVNPSIYDDYPDSNLIHRPIRCSQRILSLKKLASCLGGATLSDIESDKNSDDSESDSNDREGLSDHTLLYMGGIYGKPEKCVSVGPEHQAKLPDWSGRSPPRSNNTKKYLGTPIWQPELSEQKSSVKPVPIGRGRQEFCGCSVQGSWECVRFHVAEKRFILKCELGSAFFAMGFHRMGEEVSLSWTREEEQKFRTIIQQNPASLGKSFWGPVFLCFPYKSRETLVRYYFNVFVLKRRGYQNRISPNYINSDDDDKSDFSSMSNDDFGREADDTKNLNSIICMQNSQCIHVDELSDT